MTIIFEMGKEFWVESFKAVVTLEDAAGRYASATFTPERIGVYLGSAVSCANLQNTNDNSQAVGNIELRGAAGAELSIGSELRIFSIRVDKQAGTAGNTNNTYNALVFFRGVGR